jgi:D-methionine transport system substrate-binding protein
MEIRRMRVDRRFVLAGILALAPLLASVDVHAEQKTLRVGIMSAEDEDVWAVVAEQAKQKGLDLKLIVFNDYTQPNEALENGELDANAFQHKPYLDNQIKARGYHIVPVGFTAVWPIGLYSKKHHTVADLPTAP